MNIRKTIEINFFDEWTPPEKFESQSEAKKENRKYSKCMLCPFYSITDFDEWDYCGFPDENGEQYGWEQCPIKKYF